MYKLSLYMQYSKISHGVSCSSALRDGCLWFELWKICEFFLFSSVVKGVPTMYMLK